MSKEVILEVHCAGTPYEIGLRHGQAAREIVLRSIDFYKAYYVEMSRLEWPDAIEAALKFMPLLESDWPDFVSEMRAIADGAGVAFEDILALNLRSEISMGMMNDGCTSLYWTSPSDALLAQNWDWDLRQKSSIIALYVTPEIGPSIAQITEAGIIGKIGFNSCGVGTCLNAIRAKGVSFNKLPLHLAVRAALNSLSAASAVAVLEKVGVACSGHILIADATGGIGTEWSTLGSQKIQPKDGIVAHTNHFLCPQPEGVAEPRAAPDSFLRIDRVMELLGRAKDKNDGKGLTVESIEEILDDEQGFPCSINRMAVDGEGQMTLFSIAMDLKIREARVRIGRPTEGGQKLTLKAPR